MATAIKVGIIGAGQLARMMALAGQPLGLTFEFLDSNPDSPAADCGKLHLGRFDDPAALRALAKRVDILTFDVENVSADALASACEVVDFYPSVNALQTAQDRLLEKNLFRKLNIPAARFVNIESRAQLSAATIELGFPCVLKTRRMGYDGRGQMFLRKESDVDEAFEKFQGTALILEQFVGFDRELSLVAVRNKNGDCAFYPLTENIHKDGILHVSHAPFCDDKLNHQAQQYAQALFDHFNYAGVLTIELFATNDQLLVNEIAPRVHNSGHWTIEGATTSQFENHLRAILNWPLGDTSAVRHSAMINFLGALPDRRKSLAIPGFHFHDYRKSGRPSRKIGHGTVIRDTQADCVEVLQQISTFYSPLT